MPKLVYTTATVFFTQIMSALTSCIKSHWKEQEFHRSLHQMTCASLGGQSSDVCVLISPFCLLWPDQCWPTEPQARVDPVSTTYWELSVHGSIARIGPLWDGGSWSPGGYCARCWPLTKSYLEASGQDEKLVWWKERERTPCCSGLIWQDADQLPSRASAGMEKQLCTMLFV